MKVDYLIIGQGLAGSLLIHELNKAGKSYFVFDNPDLKKASDVAAGIINPVVFRRMTKSWLIDELYPQLLKTYAELETVLAVKLFYPIPIKKVLGEGEADFWQKKYVDNGLHNYIQSNIESNQSQYISSSFGMGLVDKSARVDLKLLIEKMKNLLQKQARIRFEKVNLLDLKLTNDQVRYHDISADKIIFCEGHAVSDNPYFQDIKFKHTKGEVLRIKTERYSCNFILNKAIFLMPEGRQFYRLGATYDWDNLSLETTQQAKDELQEKLSKVFNDRYQILDQQAGIRPTTHDRRPVIGIHPKYNRVGIFNGLGSKGTMLGPYFAKQFCDYLCGKTDGLHPEVDLVRYFRK
ncbi:FAD-binding oxidoreductase [uncultured Sunxiuqinia sp.]|uniref:NAD(P)/FAD-dependent oxidoreductase n=1 Tax=uncultured Sunxiuqinia sp. TaxID=1573825 RepID=UPI002AA73350|nr:FAD-binding oxidoreductase [uncultured Sunxiuqinia sp.]